LIRTLLILGSFLLPTLSAGGLRADSSWLITSSEAAKIAFPADSSIVPQSAVEGAGPSILVKRPKLFEKVTSPIDIFVSFVPGKSGEDPDMESLHVTLIGFFDFDITERVEKYIVGDTLDIVDADLPKGRHKIRMSIKDIGGSLNERDLLVRVAE